MKKTLKIFLLIAVFGLFNTAHAKLPLFFGDQDYFEDIASVAPIKDGRDTYKFGYRVSIKWFLAGIYAKDEGYVLSNANTYIPLNAEMIAELQAMGELPKEIPTYSLPVDYYLKGYSLWIIIAGFVIFGLIKSRKKKPVAEENTESAA